MIVTVYFFPLDDTVLSTLSLSFVIRILCLLGWFSLYLTRLFLPSNVLMLKTDAGMLAIFVALNVTVLLEVCGT